MTPAVASSANDYPMRWICDARCDTQPSRSLVGSAAGSGHGEMQRAQRPLALRVQYEQTVGNPVTADIARQSAKVGLTGVDNPLGSSAVADAPPRHQDNPAQIDPPSLEMATS